MEGLDYTELLKQNISMKKITAITLSIIILFSCNNTNEKQQSFYDTPNNGTIYISVDESFKPVIEQQIQVYQSSFPKTKIIASYKSEVDCFRDLDKDSTRLIIVAKGLNTKEEDYYKGKLYFKPFYDAVAYDAVAIIVNANSNDTVFSYNDVKDILSGSKNTPAIMDGNNATSTVRFLQDSVLHGAAFGKNVVATQGSQAVIEAVSQMPNAIGFVGLSWVGNSNEPKQVEQLKKIKLALLQCTKCTEKEVYAKPSQSTITNAQYPLARPLFIIVKENTVGLGTGFKNFISLERGQLIFRRALLAPAKMSFKKRNGLIKEEQ